MNLKETQTYSDINQKSIDLSKKIYNNYINYNKNIIKFDINNNNKTVDILVFRNSSVSKLLVYMNEDIVMCIENHFNEQFPEHVLLPILVRYFNLLQLNYNSELDDKSDKYVLKLWGHKINKYFLKQVYVDYRGTALLDLENFDWSIFEKTTFAHEKGERGSVFNHPGLDTYLYINYPELRRGSIVDNYYGVDNIDSITKSDILISKADKKYKVINTRIEDGVKVAMLVRDYKTYYNQPLFINKRNIIYIINKKEIDDAWSALFSCNRTSRRKYLILNPS